MAESHFGIEVPYLAETCDLSASDDAAVVIRDIKETIGRAAKRWRIEIAYRLTRLLAGRRGAAA